MQQIGKNIKALRQSKGWSQEQIALKLGITAPAFSKIESGQTDANFSRLEQIAQAFGITTTELINYQDQQAQARHQDQILELKKQLAQKDAALIQAQEKVIMLLEAQCA